jgi:hypothetical protein
MYGTESERKLWLELLAGSFKLIYKDLPATDTPHRADAPDLDGTERADLIG